MWSSVWLWLSRRPGFRLAMLLACAWCLAGASVPALAGPFDIALIITNETYDSDYNVAKVAYADRDGDQMERAFLNMFEVPTRNIVRVKNASTSRMIQLFGPERDYREGDLYKMVSNPRSRVYVYYSGHGAPHVSPSGVEPYLLPRDGNPGNLPLTAYPLKMLREHLARLKSDKLTDGGEVVLFLEACFSGKIGNGDELRPGTSSAAGAFDLGREEGIVEIAAAAGSQVAFWDDRAKLGMFTNVLLSAIYGDADKKEWGGDGDGKITLPEIKSFLELRLPDQLKSRGIKQTQTAKIESSTFPTDRAFTSGRPRPRPDLIGVEAQEEGRYRGLMSSATPEQIDAYINTCVVCRFREELLNRKEEIESERSRCEVVQKVLETENSPSMLGGYRGLCTRLDTRLDQRMATLESVEKERTAALERAERERACNTDQENWRAAQRSNSLEAMQNARRSFTCDQVIKAADEIIRAREAAANIVGTLGTPGKPYREPGCSNCPELVTVPAGCFTFGADRSSDPVAYENESPPTQLAVPRMFSIGRTEVTVGDWRACQADKRCQQVAAPDGDANMPMTRVSWADAEEFVTWLANKTGKPYRLPTEAEWEYAARGGDATPLGRGMAALGENTARYRLAADPRVPVPPGPVRVGSFPANAFGLHDMLGNVSEWVADCWTDNHSGRPLSLVARSGTACTSQTGRFVNRTVRGGSYKDLASRLRVTYRERESAVTRSPYIGFRVVREIPEMPAGTAITCSPRPAGAR